MSRLSSHTTDSDESGSFVHIMDIEPSAPTLDLKLAPRHDVVGAKSPHPTTQLCATIKACALPDADDSARAPVDIVVALDKSGSMHGDKLDLCIKTLELLLRELRPQDRFGLVAFSDRAVVEIPARKLTEQNRMIATTAIKKLYAGGCTNLSGGIGMAAREIRAIEVPNEVRTIFLLTDGHANRGIIDPHGIAELAGGCLTSNGADSGPPITIHNFGYGSDHDQNLLRNISEATAGGTYYFVDTDSNVVTAFGDALGGILSVVAQNVILNISVPEEAAKLGVKVSDVQHDKVKQQGGIFSVDVGDFYAEESRDVMLEVSLASGEGLVPYEGGPVPHVTISMSYTDTIQKKLVDDIEVVGNIARPGNSGISPPNYHVSVQWLRIRATRAMADAKDLSRAGDLPGARDKARSGLAELRGGAAAIGAEADPLVIQLIADLNEVLDGLETRTAYEAYGRHNIEARWQTHRMQRCAEAAPTKSNVYRGKHKGKFSSKFGTS